MDKQDYSTDFLNKSPDRALSDALQNQRDVIEFMKNNGITGEKEKIILANTKTRINWETPTLPFNMLISLLADIAKNPATKMDAKNLAICVAPRLLAEQFKTPSKENILLNNRMITFIEILIHIKITRLKILKNKRPPRRSFSISNDIITLSVLLFLHGFLIFGLGGK
ncbi:RhoGAP domain-containing protein [Providencia rettgeri]